MRLAYYNPLADDREVSPSRSRYAFEMRQGVFAEVEAQGHSIRLFGIETPPAAFFGEHRYREFDGILVHLDSHDHDLMALYKKVEAGRPWVHLFQAPAGSTMNLCSLDEADAAEQIARHLAERGLDTVGFLSVDNQAYTVSRFRALAEACARQGLTLDARWTPAFDLASGTLRPEWDHGGPGYRHPDLAGLLARRERVFQAAFPHPVPRVVVLEADPFAVAFVSACQARGLRIPEDLPVVSYNDEPASIAPWGYNILTTLRQDFFEIGRAAVQLMGDIGLGKCPPTGQTRLVGGKLIQRRTTPAARAASDSQDPEAFRKACDRWLSGNYNRAEGPDELSAFFGIGRDYFLTKFKKVFGEEWAHVIRRLRVEAAASRLRAGHDTILAVQMEVGFATHQSFNRHFKDRFGCTPGEYRARFEWLSG